MLGCLFSGQVVELRWKHITATLIDIAFAHGTRTTAAAGRWQEDTLIRQDPQERSSGLGFERILFITVHNNIDVTLRYQPLSSEDEHE